MKKYLVILFCLVGLGLSQPAHALTFLLTSDHCTGGCGAAPFGEVVLTQNGANVDISVTLSAGYSFVKSGAGDFQDFKFNATGVLLTEITVDAHNPALIATQAAVPGGYSGDGTGAFTFGITCPSCGNGGAGSFSTAISFHVANATIADLTQPNNLGNVFVADVLAPNGNTGPVDATVPTVPDGGSTAMLLGSVFLGLGMLRRRFGKS
jgi:hypothetical protein